MITKFTSSSEGKIIYYFSWLNRLVSCCFIMSRMYIRKTSREQDKIKDRHDLRSKHNLQKSIYRTGVLGKRGGWSELLTGGFRGWSSLRKFLGSKGHLDDVNEMMLTWIEVHRYSVKAKSEASQRYNDNTKRPKPKEKWLGILKIYTFCCKIQQRALVTGKSAAGNLSMRIHAKRCCMYSLKLPCNFT